ncbi:MAG: hypothetical protein JOZ52_10730 [Acidobacteria bacterium]|nr:hypothetical protein [Acidobacteriota bacterium]
MSSPIESSRYKKLTICPCCGFKFEGDLRMGCVSCGARAVGEPLARPQYELPSYGRAALTGFMGGAALLAFLTATLIAFFERATLTFDFWSMMSAAETAAWRLKWFAFPLAAVSLWLGWRICESIRKEPSRFMGSKVAHGGLAAAALFTVLMTTFIGITVPERLRQRQRASEAAYRARLYTHNRAFMEYRARFGTFPADLDDLRNLPDNDGSIADLIRHSEQTSYKPWTELAATQPAPAKSNRLRGVAIQPAALNSGSDDTQSEGVPFTNYELRLPGEDKILGNEDDWLMRDGIVRPVSALEASSSATATP